MFRLIVPCLLMLSEARNFAVVISTSRYWSNYRDKTNMGMFYHTLKQHGVGDGQIVSMFSEEVACHPRNPFPGQVFEGSPRAGAIARTGGVEVRGSEISREKFFKFLHKRQPAYTPRTNRLLSEKGSRVFVYFTGHSAVGYTKFQDLEDVDANDVAHALEHLWQTQSYSSLLWIGDTCRAASIHNAFYSPGLMAIGSSNEVDKSYSLPTVPEIGESVMDRFTLASRLAFERLKRNLTVREYLDGMDPKWLGAGVTHKVTELAPGLDSELIDYFSESDTMTKFEIDIGLWSRTNSSSVFQADTSAHSFLESQSSRIFTSFGGCQSVNDSSWNGFWIFPLFILGFIASV